MDRRVNSNASGDTPTGAKRSTSATTLTGSSPQPGRKASTGASSPAGRTREPSPPAPLSQSAQLKVQIDKAIEAINNNEIAPEAVYGLIPSIFAVPVDKVGAFKDGEGNLQEFLFTFFSLFSKADRMGVYNRINRFENLLQQKIDGKKDALVSLLALLKLCMRDMLTATEGMCADAEIQAAISRVYVAILQQRFAIGRPDAEFMQHADLLKQYCEKSPQLGGVAKVIPFLYTVAFKQSPEQARKLKLTLVDRAELTRKLPEGSKESLANWVAIFHLASKSMRGLSEDDINLQFTGVSGVFSNIRGKSLKAASLNDKLGALLIYTLKGQQLLQKGRELDALAAAKYEEMNPQILGAKKPFNELTAEDAPVESFDVWKESNVDRPLQTLKQDCEAAEALLNQLDDKDPVKIQFRLHRGLFAFEQLQQELRRQPVVELSKEQKQRLESIIADMALKARMDDGYASFMLYHAVNLLELSQKKESTPPAIYWLYRSVALNYTPANDVLKNRVKYGYELKDEHLPWDVPDFRSKLYVVLRIKEESNPLITHIADAIQPEDGALKKFMGWFKSEPLKAWPVEVPRIEAPRITLSNQKLILLPHELPNVPGRWLGNGMMIGGSIASCLATAFFAIGVYMLASNSFNLSLLMIGVTTGLIGLGLVGAIALTMVGIFLLNRYATASHNAMATPKYVPPMVSHTYGTTIKLLLAEEALGPAPEPQALADAGAYPGYVMDAARLKTQMAQPDYAPPLRLNYTTTPYNKLA